MELSQVSSLLALQKKTNNFSFNSPAAGNHVKAKTLLSPDSFFSSVKFNRSGNFQIPGQVMGVASSTGYFPNNSKLEGGFHDKMGNKLFTLQDYLAGKAPYVSIALDKNLYKQGSVKYGDKFRIPELEAKYNRVIDFRAVDTGGAFTGKKFSRVDICAANKTEAWDKSLNGSLTLIKVVP
jgi:hypothetical protein